MARPKGSRNKKTLATERQRQKLRDEGVDPKDYLKSCLADPDNYDEVRYKAACDLMEYYYPKLARNTVTGKFAIADLNSMSEDQLAALLGNPT